MNNVGHQQRIQPKLQPVVKESFPCLPKCCSAQQCWNRFKDMIHSKGWQLLANSWEGPVTGLNSIIWNWHWSWKQSTFFFLPPQTAIALEKVTTMQVFPAQWAYSFPVISNQLLGQATPEAGRPLDGTHLCVSDTTVSEATSSMEELYEELWGEKKPNQRKSTVLCRKV